MSAKKSKKTAVSKKKGLFTSIITSIAAKQRVLVALIVVLGVVGIGYYGFVKSKADTLNNTPPTVQCQNPKSDKCAQKQAESDAKFYAQLEVDCNAANRKYKDQTCGECKRGYVEKASGVCKPQPEVNCASQSRKQDGLYDCGSCLNGFTSSRNACVPVPPPTTPAPAPETSIKPTCDIKHVEYDASKNKCLKTCVIGYVLKSAACVAKTPTPDQCLPNQRWVGTGCSVTSVSATCAAEHKAYDKSNNTCLNKCIDGYYKNADTCLPLVKPQEDATVKATCDKAFVVYDVRTNTCTKTCVDGYYRSDKACVKIPNNIENCRMDVTGRCSAPVKDVKAACSGQHRDYNSDLNKCRNTCSEGYYGQDGACLPIGPGNPRTVKAACDKLLLTYDEKANICRPNCKADYVIRDGKCVKWEDTAMTQWRCRALGRVWQTTEVTSTAPNGTTTTDKTGTCNIICADATNTVLVKTDNDNTSYCKVKKTNVVVTPGQGVTLGMDQQTCRLQNRVWIEALQGCTARCKAGWYMSEGKCVEVQVAANSNEQGSGDDGNGTTDGCQADLQPVIVVGHHRPKNPGTEPQNSAEVCPDDPTGTPPVVIDGGKSVKHEVQTDLTHEACTLLGRVWVPSDKDKDGKKIQGGCSTQECKLKNAEVRLSNGTAYCEGNIVRISKQKCEDVHRIWSPLVNGCVTSPNQDSTKPVVDSKQCAKPYTVYVHHTASQGFDECIKPSALQRFQGLARVSGRPVAYVASLPASGLCKLRPHMQWVDHTCVKHRVPAPVPNNTVYTYNPSGTDSTSSSSGSQSNNGPNGGGNNANTGSSCPTGSVGIDASCEFAHGGQSSSSPTITDKYVSCDELNKNLKRVGRTLFVCPTLLAGSSTTRICDHNRSLNTITRVTIVGGYRYHAQTC